MAGNKPTTKTPQKQFSSILRYFELCIFITLQSHCNSILHTYGYPTDSTPWGHITHYLIRKVGFNSFMYPRSHYFSILHLFDNFLHADNDHTHPQLLPLSLTPTPSFLFSCGCFVFGNPPSLTNDAF